MPEDGKEDKRAGTPVWSTGTRDERAEEVAEVGTWTKGIGAVGGERRKRVDEMRVVRGLRYGSSGVKSTRGRALTAACTTCQLLSQVMCGRHNSHCLIRFASTILNNQPSTTTSLSSPSTTSLPSTIGASTVPMSPTHSRSVSIRLISLHPICRLRTCTASNRMPTSGCCEASVYSGSRGHVCLIGRAGSAARRR